MTMKASQLIAIGVCSAIGSALSNDAVSPDQANGPTLKGQPAVVAMRPVEALVFQQFRGVRRTTLKFVKRGEKTPAFMLSADVGEIDAVDNFTITLDNDAPFQRGAAVWRFTAPWQARTQADPSPSTRRFESGEIGKPIRLPIPGVGHDAANCLPCAWRRNSQLIVTTTVLPLIDNAWVALAPVDQPPLVEFGAREFGTRNLAAVAEPPTELLLGGGIAALAAAMARRRPAA
jgi:hypothetical protein